MGSFFFGPPGIPKNFGHHTVVLGGCFSGRTRIDKAKYFFGIVGENIHSDHCVSKVKGRIAGV
jgi:hypothetical protein